MPATVFRVDKLETYLLPASGSISFSWILPLYHDHDCFCQTFYVSDIGGLRQRNPDFDKQVSFLCEQEARGGGGEGGDGQLLLPAPLRLAGGGGGRGTLHRTLPRNKQVKV